MLKENIIYILSKGLSGLLSLTSLSIISYYWDSDIYGRFSLILINANIISILFFYVSKIYYTRFNKSFNNSENVKEIDKILNLFIIISTITCFALSPFIENILISLLISTFQIKFEIFQEKQRINFKAIGYLISSVIKALIYLGCIFMLGNILPNNINSIAYSYLLPFLLIVAFNYKNYSLKINTDISLIKKIINFGYPFLLTPFSNAILLNYYRLAIKSKFGEAELGGFSYVSDLCENTIIAVMMAINLSGYPRLIKYYEDKDDKNFKKQANFNIYAHLIIFFSISTLYLIGHSHLSKYFVSENYRTYLFEYFILILIASFIKGLKLYYVDHYLLLHTDKKINFISTVLYLTLNIGLLPIILKFHNNINGILYCMIICNYLYLLFTVFLINRNYKVKAIQVLPILLITFTIGVIGLNKIYLYFCIAGLIISLNKIKK